MSFGANGPGQVKLLNKQTATEFAYITGFEVPTCAGKRRAECEDECDEEQSQKRRERELR